LLVDRIGCQPTRFEVHAITSNHDPVEGEPRFRAVPCYELVESEFVDAARTGRPGHANLRLMEAASDLAQGVLDALILIHEVRGV